MGFFGTFLYDGTRWTAHPPDQDRVETAEPWLLVDIHDSDIATLTYRPATTGSGTAFLGFTPRTYFEDEAASAPTDVECEAAGLAAWWSTMRGGAAQDELAVKREEIATYLAQDLEPSDVDVDEEDDEFTDEDVFVEARTARFLTALQLPIPQDLPQL